MINPQAHIRLARPTRDPAALERFYVQGLGLEVLYRATGGPDEQVAGSSRRARTGTGGV